MTSQIRYMAKFYVGSKEVSCNEFIHRYEKNEKYLNILSEVKNGKV